MAYFRQAEGSPLVGESLPNFRRFRYGLPNRNKPTLQRDGGRRLTGEAVNDREPYYFSGIFNEACYSICSRLN